MQGAGYIATIDGGGSGTRLRLYDPDGQFLAEETAGPSSLSLGVDRAWESVGEALSRAVARAGAPAPDRLRLRIVAGFAGGRTRTNQDAFRARDPFNCRDITIVTDGFASLMGALGGRPGLVLAVGTGVTTYALWSSGEFRQASGWGFCVGDEGGGAWIGMKALQALSKWQDGRLRNGSAIFPALAREVGGDYDAIQNWLKDARPKDFAALAPIVVSAARDGDARARAILDAGARELEEAVSAVDAPDAALPIALLGGLRSVYPPHLSEALRSRIVEAEGSALDGLWLIASKGQKIEGVE